jgi:hypothetical protein
MVTRSLGLNLSYPLNRSGILDCRRVLSRDGETAESATLAGCTAPVGPALSCRLIDIRREWPAYGNLGADVLIALASLRSELSPGKDWPTCERLCDWAKTVCNLYTIDLSSTFTCKAEAVGKRIRRGGGTDEGGCSGLSWEQAPVVYLLRNMTLRRVQRPYALVPPHRLPVDHIWGLKTVARS